MALQLKLLSAIFPCNYYAKGGSNKSHFFKKKKVQVK